MADTIKNARLKVSLRALEPEDLDRVLEWHNDPELYTTLGGHFRHVSADSEREWLRRRIGSRDEVNLAICTSETKEHIGNIYLRDIDWINRHGELHAFIAAPQHRGKGYGSAAVQQLVKHAFEDLGLVRLYLHVLASNAAGVATYTRCGFAVEGRLHRHVLKKGNFEDVLIMGLCRE
jgi:RimJ/RimL family protein N-acetyltransferase